jgi:hypothetical protein
VAFVPIVGSKARELKPAKGFPVEYTQDNSRIQEAVSGRRAFGAEAVSGPAAKEESNFRSRRAKRRTRQILPIMVQGWRPAKPDAGPVIKAGFYRVDKATGDRKP